jgi:hypothetical protein
MKRRIRDLDTVADQQLANLGEADAVTEPALDRGPLLDTPRPSIAPWSTAGGMQPEQDQADLPVGDRRPHADALGRGGREIPADGFRIEPELGGDPLLRQALASEPKDFPDFDHRDLAIHPRLLVPGQRPRTGDLYRAVRRKGGKVLKNSPRKGGKVLKNLTPGGERF